MDFTHDGDYVRTGGAGGGISAAAMMMMAVVVFVIIFIIAVIFLAAFAFKDKDKRVVDEYPRKENNIAEMMAMMMGAKAMGNDNGNYKNHADLDRKEILEKLEHNEDRAVARQTQSEIGALGLLMQKEMSDNEKLNLTNFAKLENQLGALTMGMTTLLTERNNDVIVDKLLNRLAWGKAC